MTMLFAVVMLYGWQHLSSIEIGYHVETEKSSSSNRSKSRIVNLV